MEIKKWWANRVCMCSLSIYQNESHSYSNGQLWTKLQSITALTKPPSFHVVSPPPTSSSAFFITKTSQVPSASVSDSNACIVQLLRLSLPPKGKRKGGQPYYAYSLSKHTDLSFFSESQKSQKQNRKWSIIIRNINELKIHHKTDLVIKLPFPCVSTWNEGPLAK